MHVQIKNLMRSDYYLGCFGLLVLAGAINRSYGQGLMGSGANRYRMTATAGTDIFSSYHDGFMMRNGLGDPLHQKQGRDKKCYFTVFFHCYLRPGSYKT